MYSNYFFVVGCGLTGGVIFNAWYNIFQKPKIYDSTVNIFNYGMLFGLGIGSSLAYIKNTPKLIKASE